MASIRTVLCLLLPSLFLPPGAFAVDAKGETPHWRAARVQGHVRCMAASSGEWRELKEGQEIRPGDEVRTLGGSLLVAASGDWAALRVEGAGNMRFAAWNVVRPLSGRVLIRTVRLDGAPSVKMEAGGLSVETSTGAAECSVTGDEVEWAVSDARTTLLSSVRPLTLPCGYAFAYRGGQLHATRRLDLSEKERFDRWTGRQELKPRKGPFRADQPRPAAGKKRASPR